MFRYAEYDDIEVIMSIVAKTITLMKKEGNPQWNEDYPTKEVFINDIESHSLYIYETLDITTHYESVVAAAFICINDICPIEYSTVDWSKDITEEATYVHRLAIDPAYRRMGIGKALLTFADDMAKYERTDYLRSDTNSMNRGMNALFEKCGYTKRGEIYLRFFPEHFNCYDKVL